MIKKFISIKNVGKFRNCHAAGDIEFRKLSLIFGENGRGKTTLGAIFRSLQSGDPNPILERRTLDSKDSPRVEALSDSGTNSFKEGVWTATHSELAIFDSRFISQNVYSGDYVQHDHKKNLARIIVGEQGVLLSNRVDNLDAEIRLANTQVTEAKRVCEELIPKGMDLNRFVGLPEDADIDSKIDRAQRAVTAIEHAGEIKSKATPKPIALPSPPSNLDALLAKDLEGVSEDAETKVRQQIEAHQMGPDGQVWLAQGFDYVNGEACPFCGQNIDSNELVVAYRAFFSKSYRAFKDQLDTMKLDFDDTLDDSNILPIQNTLNQNDALVEFWKNYVEAELPAVSFDVDVAPVLSALREGLLPYVARKIESPLEVVSLGPEVAEVRGGYAALVSKIATYNEAVVSVGERIDSRKEKTASGDLAKEKSELLTFQAQKIRHAPEAIAACDTYRESLNDKKTLDGDKKQAKDALDAYADTVMAKYENQINGLLKRFNAGFRIANSKLQYPGGKPSSSFSLSINNVPVELGDQKTPPGTPCFRSTMSSGDRSTLALAFFLIQLHERTDLAGLTVVFDDPFTSLDSFRQHATRDQIRKLVGLANQVIVMSHYPQFLNLVAEGYDTTQLRLLCIARHGRTDSQIMPWDMDAALASGHDQDVATLAAFHHGEAKDHRSVMRCIRPVVEACIRQQQPGAFPKSRKEWLGDMLAGIRNVPDEDLLAELKPNLDDLSSLNDYTKQYHHDDNTARSYAGQIQETELQGAVENTLEFIGVL